MLNSTSADHIDFPRYHRVTQLRSLGHGYYGLIYDYLRHAWSGSLISLAIRLALLVIPKPLLWVM